MMFKKLCAWLTIYAFLFLTMPTYADMVDAAAHAATGQHFTWQVFKTNLHLMFFTPKTWYIDTVNGGHAANCTGLGTTPYNPAGGTGQPCPFLNMLDMTSYSGAWTSLAGGDTIQIVQSGNTSSHIQYLGQTLNGLGYDWHTLNSNCSNGGGSSAVNCFLPILPNGTAGNPTTIMGANAGACTTESAKSWIMGLNDEYVVFLAQTSQYVSYQCMHISQPDSCTIAGTATGGCVPGTNNYAKNGFIMAAPSGQGAANITLTDITIAGMANRCILGSHFNLTGTDVTSFTRVGMYGCGMSNFDYDSGNGTNTNESVGTMNMTSITGYWSGCVAVNNYDATPLLSGVQYCANGNSSGGYGDDISMGATQGTWNWVGLDLEYGTQDCFDSIHVGDYSPYPTINIVNYKTVGCMGQQFKIGGIVTAYNGLIVGNCRRDTQPFSPNPSNYNQYLTNDICRAGNDAVIIQLQGGTTQSMTFTTIVSYQLITYDLTCDQISPNCTSGTTKVILENNLHLGFPDIGNSSTVPTGLYYDSGTYGVNNPFANTGAVLSHMLWYNMRGGSGFGTCPQDATYETNAVCTNPVLVSQGSINTTTLDGVNFNLTSGSPAIAAGVTISGQPLDYSGYTRPGTPAIGALEYQSGVTVTSIAITPNPGATTVGGTLAYTCTATLSNSTTTPCTTPVWSSATTSKATINSSSGILTGVAVGTSVITAAASGFTSPGSTVTVSAAPTGGPRVTGKVIFQGKPIS